ncbi:hypothetical protein OG874_25660 [Nocardia sp. NBC_00565]|uniref:hypothetical protein n=1 Tax=Nocardia sp. NBC_00565 TaxID=2975993 RepID=UPI002E7FEDE5|nr:hypothetical protein [Nocardia sp. NBC_00565]WUC00278.1 hypothetical protein OG874_25660 [Nocardia sp. NBC_00565]
MSTEDGRSPGLFSHDALPLEPSVETAASSGGGADFRPVFSRSDGSAPGSYPQPEQGN